MLGTFIYLIKQGFENVWKNKLMFMASVLIVSTSMITLGIFVIIGDNTNALVDKIMADGEIVAYLNEDITETETKAVEESISEIPGVNNMTFESKEEALKKAREMFFDENDVDLTTGWEENNIFSASFSIYMDDLTLADTISSQIKEISGVKKVSFAKEEFMKINKFADILEVVFLVIFILLIALSLLVVSNTIKLVLHARRKEINIMKYIGATDAFVKFPFIVEGIIVGVVGAFLAWFITIEIYEAFKGLLIQNELSLDFLDLSDKILYMNLIIGIGISCVASAISIKKYLKV